MAEHFQSRPVQGNAWLGVSVEDQAFGKPRIPLLQSVDAQIRFFSVEPLLEDHGELDLHGVHCVTVGGEFSASSARAMKGAWVAHIQRQCEEAGVNFFFNSGARGAKMV